MISGNIFDIFTVMKKEDTIDYLDMHKLRKALLAKESGTQEEKEAVLAKKFEKGISFRGQLINMIPVTFYNPLWDREYTWYYLECPKCKKKCWKIYDMEVGLVCGKCRKKSDGTRAVSVVSRINKIQHYLDRLSNEPSTLRIKNNWMAKIVKYYNLLKPYHRPDPAIVFKGLQRWCEKRLADNRLPSDYKQALKDVLTRLHYIRQVLLRTKLTRKSTWKDDPGVHNSRHYFDDEE